MTDLIACLSSGKGTWQDIKTLIEKGDWENIYLVTDDFGVKRFSSDKKVNFVLINSRGAIKDIVEGIRTQLKEKIIGTEVALNLVSGTGKEHMAIISAILKLGLGMRLVNIVDNEVKEV